MDCFDWVTDPAVAQALQACLAGEKLSLPEANKSVYLLIKEGEYHTQRIVGRPNYIKNFPTNRHGGAWSAGQPVGWVDHYTAAPTCVGTLMWFSNANRGPNAGQSSSHHVIDKDGTIITLVNPLTTIAWHATWSNYSHIGVEHVCSGLLGKTKEGAFTFMGNTRYPAVLSVNIQEVNGQYWEPFTTKQLISNLALKRLLICAIPTLRQAHFVDHQVIDPKNKIDCGPLWPLKEINQLAFSFLGLVEEMDWMNSPYLTVQALASFKDAATKLIGSNTLSNTK